MPLEHFLGDPEFQKDFYWVLDFLNDSGLEVDMQLRTDGTVTLEFFDYEAECGKGDLLQAVDIPVISLSKGDAIDVIGKDDVERVGLERVIGMLAITRTLAEVAHTNAQSIDLKQIFTEDYSQAARFLSD